VGTLLRGRWGAQRDTARSGGILACAAAVLCLGGCATSENQGGSIPLDRRYQPPQRSERTPTLAGLQKSAFMTGYTIFVSSVDGKCVMSGRDGWKDALPVSAGSHKIVVRYESGVHEARVKLTLQAESGHTYRIGYLDGGGTIIGPGLYLDIWLDDLRTGEHATSAIRAGMGENRQGRQLCGELFQVD
jgi:hypothetical protein